MYRMDTAYRGPIFLTIPVSVRIIRCFLKKMREIPKYLP